MITDTRHDDMIARREREVVAVEQECKAEIIRRMEENKRKWPNMSKEQQRLMLQKLINEYLGV